ncbi:uncharacterized protein LOC128209213 [Mya arenaria]|uniref:uncharacterized protein LOC128209213 n=1 Tax=Mya arenaria TaxID=6604 RepID=UPI0022E605C1|nr:uncharacterized protein LOC128209213 [Mya arenaria]XP_052769113.1 uncharacterized protein LOC128209213 [Mya arenaria]
MDSRCSLYTLHIAASTTSNEFFEAVEPLENIIRVSGNGSLAGRHDRKDQLLEALCRFLVIENLKPAYDQFSEGLRTLGLFSAIEKDSLTLEPFFIHQDKTLTAEDMFSLYRRTLSSEDGSNRKKKEDETVSWWRDMVLDMEDEGTLPALLSFLTGLDEIPPLGFEYEGSISFRHSAELSR